MKRQAILSGLILIGFIGFGFSQTKNTNKPKDYKFTIHVKGLQDSIIYLANYYHNLTPIVDSAKVTKNTSPVRQLADTLSNGRGIIGIEVLDCARYTRKTCARLAENF